jgi:tetratricopeptide (TPR) repeat protein
LRLLQQALARDPESRSLWETQGYLWGERAEYERTHSLDPRPSLDQSTHCFEVALQQGPSFRSTYGMANTALMRGQWEAVHGIAGAAATLEQAGQSYRQAGQMAPYHAVVASELVEVALWRGRALGLDKGGGRQALDAGEAVFQTILGRFPNSAMLWLRGAQVAEALGRREEAKFRIGKALKLDPHNPEIQTTVRSIR